MHQQTDTAARSGQVPKLPPLRAQVWWKQLTAHELLVLHAMIEHCSDGRYMYAAVARIATYCKLTVRTVQRVLHGDPRTGAHGLVARRALVLVHPANKEKRRPACYRIQLEAIPDDPRMERYVRRQRDLPFIAADRDVTKWATDHPGLWQRIRGQVYALYHTTYHTGAPPTDAIRVTDAARAIAVDLGMPEPLARRAIPLTGDVLR